MRESLLEAIKKTKGDCQFLIYNFNENGNFKTDFKDTKFIEDIITDAKEICINPKFSDIVMIDSVGVSLDDFDKNLYYETLDTEGFMKHISKYNKYYHVFIKLDKDNNTITFKLGDNCKTLELIEEGFDGFVSRPYKNKYLKCVSFSDLERHINDEFWNPRMVDIGRYVLKIKSIIKRVKN